MTLKSSQCPLRISDGTAPSVNAYFDRSPESPDGHLVAFSQFREIVPGPVDVVVCNRDGTQYRVIGASPHGDANGGAPGRWLDARRYQYNRGDGSEAECVIVDVLTQDEQVLRGAVEDCSAANGLGIGKNSDQSLQDNDHYVYTLDLQTGKQNRIVCLDDILHIHPTPEVERYRDALIFTHTKWSPDGQFALIVFTNSIFYKAGTADRFLKSIFICAPDGSGLRHFSGGCNHPTWASNSEGIYGYELSDSEGEPLSIYGDRRDLDQYSHAQQEFMVLRKLNTQLPEVLHYNAGCHGAMSPDGTRIVTDMFDFANSEGQAVISLYPRGGEQSCTLATMPQGDISHQTGMHPHPAWSPNGRRVYFNARENGIPQLYAIDLH